MALTTYPALAPHHRPPPTQEWCLPGGTPYPSRMQAKVTAAAQSPARSGPPYGPPLLPLHFYRADGMAAQVLPSLPPLSLVPLTSLQPTARRAERKYALHSHLAEQGATFRCCHSLPAGRSTALTPTALPECNMCAWSLKRRPIPQGCHPPILSPSPRCPPGLGAGHRVTR